MNFVTIAASLVLAISLITAPLASGTHVTNFDDLDRPVVSTLSRSPIRTPKPPTMMALASDVHEESSNPREQTVLPSDPVVTPVLMMEQATIDSDSVTKETPALRGSMTTPPYHGTWGPRGGNIAGGAHNARDDVMSSIRVNVFPTVGPA